MTDAKCSKCAKALTGPSAISACPRADCGWDWTPPIKYYEADYCSWPIPDAWKVKKVK